MKNNYTKQVVSAIAVLVGSLTIIGCMQSQTLTSTQAVVKQKAEQQLVKLVNQAFYHTFKAGDWYYQGAENQGGSVNAYIQIPAALDMPKDVQRRYLKQSVCPSKENTAMWHSLKNKDKPLSVHIYTFSKRHTVFAECDNPLA